VWPVTLDISGRGHGRSPDHRPHGDYSALVGAGGTHESRRDRQLYEVEISPTRSDSCPLDVQSGGTTPFMGLPCADRTR